MALVAKQAKHAKFCDRVKLVTEKCIDPIALKNAEMFQAVEDNDPEADEVALEAIKGMNGGVSLLKLISMTGLEERGYRALIRLFRDRVLEPVSLEAIRSAFRNST